MFPTENPIKFNVVRTIIPDFLSMKAVIPNNSIDTDITKTDTLQLDMV